ncbi:hypothetical protein PFISCL1PPCAC_6348, partial [Pristionchus fissidentatus]
ARSRCRSSSATVVQVISRQSTASPPVAIDVEKLEQQMADKKKRTVTFSDKPPEKHSAVVYETENEVPVKLSFRERFFLLLRRLILLFILVFLIAFIVFLAVQILLLFLYLLAVDSRSPLDVAAVPTADGKALQIDLNEEHSTQLLLHWMEQAMSGLMAAVATNKLDKVANRSRTKHEVCSKKADTVNSHAKCVVELMDAEKREKRRNKVRKGAKKIVLEKEVRRKPTRKHKKSSKKTGKSKHPKRKLKRRKITTTTTTENPANGGFGMRAKRSIVSASSYTLKSPNQFSLFSGLAKSLTKTVRQLKNKDEMHSKDWKQIIEEIQEESKRLKARKTIKKMFAKRLAMIQEDSADGKIDQTRPLSMKELDDLDESDPHALLEEARKAEKKLSKEDRILRQPLHLIREAVKLGMMAGGQNVTNFEDRTLKLFSPRLMSVFPEEENEEDVVNFLSPSLFSLHNEGKGVEKATSLSDGFGLVKGKEQEEWLSFVMEAAGDTKLKKARGIGLEEDEMRSPTGQPLYFTRDNVTKLYGKSETDKIDIFEKLQNTYTEEQVEEQKKNGYFIMRPDQLRMIYGEGSPYHDEERLNTLTTIPTSEMPSHIENNIRAVSKMDSFSLRKRNVILAPVVLVPLIFQSALLSGPVILSPLVLSPSILSPAIFGPVILGPWVFVPVILSPRAFSPLILNPLIFSPIILSPLLAHPLILSPGVFNPIILSPLLLSPFILSPQVFTPLILSPFALNPLILNPMVGSPLILSPFVLSPIIMSPQYMFAVIMSPYALSPLIESPLNGAEVVMSPSWLS